MTASSAPGERRILLVEDNAFNARVVGMMLGRLGYRHDLASSGTAALAATASATYDVILMDFQMPDIDGAETTRRIRAGGGPNAGVPIVGLTAVTSESESQLCRDSGMNTVVAKPIKIEHLAETLAQFLAST